MQDSAGDVRMRRVALTVEIEIPETEFADLAEEALRSGRDLRQLIASRYAGSGIRRPAGRKTSPGPDYRVGDYAHLFDQAPPGQSAYRGSGRAPAWLHELIRKEIAG